MAHEYTVRTVEAEYASRTFSKADFARRGGLSVDQAERLRAAGAIDHYSDLDLQRLHHSNAAFEVIDSPDPIAVIRLGRPGHDPFGRRIGYADDMTIDEITESASKFWTTPPDALSGLDVVTVTYAGIVVGAFALDGEFTFDEGSGRHVYPMTPIVVVGSSLIADDLVQCVSDHAMSQITQTQLAAALTVGMRLRTRGGAPVIVDYPLSADEV